ELHQQALDNLSKYRWEQSPFVPPALQPSSGGKYLGAINIGNASGGVNWPGSGFDPETAIFYTQAGNSAVTSGGFGGEEFEFIRVENQTKPRQPRWEADPEYGRYGTNQPGSAGEQAPPPGRGGAGRGGAGRGRGAEPGAAAAAAAPGGGGGGRGSLTQGLNGLPIVKPPYGVMAAIDLNNGTLKWQVAHGDTPDAIRNNPELQGLNIPKTGQNGSVRVLCPKPPLISARPAGTTPPRPPPRPTPPSAYH